MKMRPLCDTATPVGMAPWNCATGSRTPHARSLASPVHCALLTGRLLMRFHNDLYAIVLLFLEHRVSLWGLIERQAVCDHEARVDLSFLDSLQQRLQIALYMRLASPHGERTVHERSKREFIHETAVNAN